MKQVGVRGGNLHAFQSKRYRLTLATCVCQLVLCSTQQYTSEDKTLPAGLNLLLEMLQSFQHSDFATQFHKTYYLNLMQETFAVMTGWFRVK